MPVLHYIHATVNCLCSDSTIRLYVGKLSSLHLHEAALPLCLYCPHIMYCLYCLLSCRQ